ncbi:MAG: SDR family oxidoreductase [Pedosphaera sp.]|nr:SDR family oxidoreductase [Pedosphaera sp.]
MRNAWITGAGGLIGNYLLTADARSHPGFSAVSLTRGKVDLLDFAAVSRLFQSEQPELIIHCAAMSKSPECQASPERALQINVNATRHLAQLATNTPFIFLSSDLIFDGCKGDYIESDQPNPLSVYAETKALAEQVVLANPLHAVIRTSLNGGTSPRGDRGFNEELRRAWIEGKSITLFDDEFRCPIPAAVTARAIWEFAERYQPGLYHLAGAEKLSRWQIGQLIAARWPQLNPQIRPGSLRDYQGAPRSPDTSLNCDKIQRILPFKLPGLAQWLAEHLNESF